ncbi:uncharacterized protein L201_002597 [Kwoniella dendrophila CBS 6074]|uniref:Alpha-ketoglutarate-dependent dioxygenase AlkB-like domain-containing protein n=1 Tax=Kwoniella dendrophila CBS 6074 TaxID=1295534 RepID=A0AAX4JSY9_9TREE
MFSPAQNIGQSVEDEMGDVIRYERSAVQSTNDCYIETDDRPEISITASYASESQIEDETRRSKPIPKPKRHHIELNDLCPAGSTISKAKTNKVSRVCAKKSKRANYSNWSYRQVPPNILSLLRFDHYPSQEPLILPSENGIQQTYQNALSNQLTSTKNSYEVETGIDQLDPDVSNTRQPLSLGSNKEQRPRRGRRPRLKQTTQIDEAEINYDIQITPLPQIHFGPHIDVVSQSNDIPYSDTLTEPIPFNPVDSEAINPMKPRNQPPVWADSRQELCEALPYYRSFQSGLYMHKRSAFGYLLEAYPAPRDVWAHNGKVVISHGGGQCIRTTDSDGKPGPAALQADQSRSDARVDTLLRAHERRTPIVLIAGKGYDGLPWELDCAYIVLGWYWISLTWVEAEEAPSGVRPPEGRSYFHRYKIRFDWVVSQGEPWWINRSQESDITTIPAEDSESDVEVNFKEGSSLTALPSDHECIITEQPIKPFQTPSKSSTESQAYQKSKIHELAEHLSQSPKLRTESLLNTGTMSEKADTGSDTLNLSAWTASISDCDQTPKCYRSHWPGQNSLSTPLPTLIVTDGLLRQSNFNASSICTSCHHSIWQIYQEGLICFQSDCELFFKIIYPDRHDFVTITPKTTLTYNRNFLEPIPTPPEVQIPYDVRPSDPVEIAPETDEINGEVNGRTLWKGWVCKKCGRANCRFRWEVWECRNCGDTLAPIAQSSIILRKDLPMHIIPFLGDSKIDLNSGITSSMKWLEEIKCLCVVYELPFAGRVYHLMQPDLKLADDLLEEYQVAANEGGWFQRRPLKAVSLRTQIHYDMKGQFLAQHFAVNFGASYKYQVDTLSYPFEKAPKCVLMSLSLLTQRVQMILGENIGYNEILSVMYREGQKMSWHDDGEAGLGPVVSSLSLGNQAVMSFRTKTPRTNLNKGFYSGISEPKHIPPTALSFTLSHGDIMIMQGREIQKRYDHKVVPMGFRIASTARVIDER